MTITAIGIDLGTTYSCVAIWRHDSVEIIANDQGNRITPSYVAFNNTERLIGDAAKNQSTMNPTNTIYDAKRLIGRRFNDAKIQEDMKMWPFQVISIDGKPKIRVQYRGEEKNFTPEEISSMVLTKMKQTASAYLGEKITTAVVTVPAYFNDSQRQATKDAATIAGLEILRILNEPTAAALAYGLDQHLTGERRILVFDLGGGTFDVSVLFVDEGSLYEVKATAGDTHLGGEDFDNRLVNYFAKDFFKKHQKDVKSNPRSLRRLKTAAERAKRILSSTTETTIEIDALFEGIDFYTKISRARFEELCSDLFRGTLDPVEKALTDSKYNKKSIDDVIMVGGSTRIPKLQSILQNFFDGKPLSFSINPDEAVAYGAAVQAAILTGNSNKDIQNVLLVDVTPLSLGIATSGDVMTKIIRRNSRIPCKRSEKFTTHIDNQSGVTIKVYQGERTMCRHNNLLGIFDLTGIPPSPRGSPRIRVTFDINANGILKVSAQEKMSGTYKNIVIKNDKGRLTNTEINQMIKEAEMFHLNDAKERKRVQARGRFEEYLLRMKKTFKGVPDGLISEEEKATVLRELYVYLRWLDHNQGTDLEDYETKWQDIERNIEPILVKLQQDRRYKNIQEQCKFDVD